VALATFAPAPLNPDWPWIPEGLILEALTQVSGLVLVPERSEPEVKRGGGFLAAVSQLRFLRPLEPKERLILKSRLDLRLGSAARFRVEACVEADVLAEGILTLGGIF
jgi:3-hydroxymyristoyl/3-hydroxydecanoyl-(acyl carrier protein) dehydratase